MQSACCIRSHAGHAGIYLQRVCHISTKISHTTCPVSYLPPSFAIFHEKHPQKQYVEMFPSSLSGLKNKREYKEKMPTTLSNEMIRVKCSLVYGVLMGVCNRIDIYFTGQGFLKIFLNCPIIWELSSCCKLLVEGV